MIVRAAPPSDFAWLYVKTGHLLSGTARAIEAIDDNGRILGMVGYDDWTPSTVRMHVALESSMAARVLLEPAFFYPFVEVGVSIVLAVIVSTNRRCLRLAKRVGFREMHRIVGGWDEGADLVFMRLDKSACHVIFGRKAA
jgi:RimJ/RimL family protein N-acetyltransferase